MHAPGTSPPTDWLAFAVIALGTLVGPLDSAVNVAFPAITAHFSQPDSAIQWVIVSYVITYATLILIFGRLGDLFGHLAVFRAGLAVSAAAFLASGLADAFEILLATRALQGIGTAMVLSCGPALAASVFGEARRSHALGSYTAVLGVGMTLGPSVGGLLVAVWDWQAVFLFRLPIAIGALALTFAIRLPEQPRSAGGFTPMRATALAALLCVGLVGISRLRHGLPPMDEIAVYLVIVAIAVLLLAFARRDARSSSADRRPMWDRDLVLVMLTGIAVNLVGFAFMLFVPYFLVRVGGFHVATAGIVLAASPLGIIAGGAVSSRLAARIGPKAGALCGALLVATSTVWIGLWTGETLFLVICAAAFFHGLGLGLYQAAQLDVATAVLAREDRGVAGSLVMLTRTLGVVMAASALTALFVAVQAAQPEPASADAFLAAFRQTLLTAAGVLGALLVLSLVRPALWFSRSGAA
jgi:MFS family permease